MRALFVREGRLALPWRILFFLVLFEIVQLASRLAARAVGQDTFGVVTALEGVARAGGVLGVTLLARRFFDRGDFASLGLDHPRKRALDISLGFLAGGAIIGIVFAIEVGLGWARVVGIETATRAPGHVIGVLGATLIKYFGVGIAEEVALRGYVYQNLAERGPVWRATLITGLLFGLLHGALAGFGPTFVLAMMLFTALLVVSRLVTGSLWFAIAFHAAWDWIQDPVLGLSNVGERDFGHALLHVEQEGPKALVGSPPAIEGGLLFVTILGLALVGAVAWSRGRVRGLTSAGSR